MFVRRALFLAALFAAAPLFAATVFVDIPSGQSLFVPRSIVINVGDTVTWRNPDVAPPRGIVSDDGGFTTFPQTAGPWQYSQTFNAAGAFAYHETTAGSFDGIGMSGMIFVGRTSHPPTEHILQLTSWEFHPTDGAAVASATLGTNFVKAMSGSSGGTVAVLYTGLHLPNGAQVTGLELDACDSDATPQNDVSAAIIYCNEPTTGCVGGNNATTMNTPAGCGFYHAVQSFVVDNLGYSISLRVLLPVSASLSFRTVRVYYTVPVSYAPPVARFTDVPTTHPFFRYIEALAAAGITGGCAPGQYCPDAPITRGQMAVFIARGLGLFWPN